MTNPPGSKIRALLAYGGAAAVSVYSAFFLLNYRRADIRVPFDYGGDATFHAYLVKSVVDHGWFLTNPNVGAPTGLRLHDFPILDNVHLLTIKAMSLFSDDWALLFNVYFLLGFPLITLSAMAAFRQFGVAYGPAIVGSVLYAFLPSRLIKGEGHLFLDVFYQVPLAIVVLLWVCGDDPPLTRDRGPRALPGLELRRGRSWSALFICLLGASMSAYYSFFTALLLVAGGVWASVERRSARNAVAGLALAAAVTGGLAANALPTAVYQMRHGPNVEVTTRGSGEAEFYGMKIATLLLPVNGHRIASLARIKQRYNDTAPLGGESNQATLGAVGAVGFLALLGIMFWVRHAGGPHAELWRPLAALSTVAVLIATVGGFGSLFALLVSPQIRTYTRMNVLLGFMSLFAVVLLLERLQQYRPALGQTLLPIVLAIGLFDQTSPSMIRPYAATRRAYADDGDFVRRIEAAVPTGALILELPYLAFPEGRVARLGSYDPLMPYLHSRTLRWTFPSMGGRDDDLWLRNLSQETVPALVTDLGVVGGAGILVDRAGYDDEGRAVEADLRAELRSEPIASADGRRLFFKLPVRGAK